MKKASLLLAFLFAAFASLVAQEPVTLTFTASTQNGLYCPFDAVNVTNVTRGWTETLAYPDTVLVLTSTVGLEEQSNALNLGKAYPNPFTEETCVLVEMPVACDALLQAVRIDGTVVATCQQHLQAGLHNVKVSLSSPSLAFLMVSTSHGRQVARMVCTGQGSRDGIVVETLSTGQKPSNQHVRSDATGEFQPGDMMRYTSVLFDGANTIYSNTITQQQYENQDVTLYFDLALPEVATNQVTDITPNTATGGGEVIATGGISVTERGICWSASHNPTTSDNHANNGTGTGTYSLQMNDLVADTTYYVRAYASNRIGIAYGDEVSFATIPSCPVGAINGLFTVNSNGDQVYFSLGNLQYQASTGTWKFANNQWDQIGETNASISQSYDGWIDLFGWGTSGYEHGANCFQPWSISTDENDYFAYGDWQYNLYDQSGMADWGYNAIANGGNDENSGWRTPSTTEWDYVLSLRNTISGIRYAKATVNNTKGVVLLPDNWDSSIFTLNNVNIESASFASNTITAETWSNMLEINGAVFLPVTGTRNGNTIYHSSNNGSYWSSSIYTVYANYVMNFENNYLHSQGFGTRFGGFSVRLVKNYQ